MKCIEDEISFELPEGWEWCRVFSIIGDLPYGTAQKSSLSGKIAVLRMGNIQSCEIDYADLVYSSDDDDIKKYTLLKNDLLFNRTNSAELVGKTAIYRGNIPAIYAGYLIRVRPYIDSEYLNAVMNSGYAKSYCNAVKTDGVNQSNINAQKLGTFLIPVPQLAEQTCIKERIISILPLVDVIKAEKTDLTNLIGTTKAKILDLAIRGQLVPQDPNDEPASVLLKRIRAEKEALIKSGKLKRDKKESVIFKGEDNSYYEKIGDETRRIDDEIPFNIPETWSFVRLKHIGTVVGGGTPKTNVSSYWNGEIPWLTPADLSGYKAIYISAGERKITQEGLDSSSAQLMPEGTVLYSSRAPIGYVAISANPITTNQGFKSVVPYDFSMSEYLYYRSRGIACRNELQLAILSNFR